MHERRTPLPHAPLHQLGQRGTYFVTAGTYLKEHHFRARERPSVLHRANRYPWCSAAWFERTASPAMVKSIYRFKIDQVKVSDEFAPAVQW